MVWIGGEAGLVGKRKFDVDPSQAVFPAFGFVAGIPVELHEMYVRLCGQSRGGWGGGVRRGGNGLRMSEDW